jgi:mannose-6-phosphate isomerase class I
MRAGSVTNLGTTESQEPFSMYKRFYFVDWVLLNEHKNSILNRISVIADGQWPDNISWMMGTSFKEGLEKLSQSAIRVRPWFEPGAWGGQWIKKNIPGLNKDAVNYAWSFELIVPENGIVFESNGLLLEVSFDFLMFSKKEAVLGSHVKNFGDEFPIRFDFLDTYKGGNLSIQCHPSLQYIRENFGEQLTQDETYYILDCHDNAKVYLGFQENINPRSFKEALITSQNENIELDIEEFVQSFKANKHDLFLIPNQTVHSAGEGNLVLEISATPYIFTFKMYDWLRLDLDGKPRPINIEHAFNNLDFNRKGERVQQELISKPAVLETGSDWQIIHLPTHQNHFYDIHRIEFTNSVEINNEDGCHVLMLVEGSSILVITANGISHLFNYAETFIIPAAAKSYQLINKGNCTAKVIKAFLK